MNDRIETQEDNTSLQYAFIVEAPKPKEHTWRRRLIHKGSMIALISTLITATIILIGLYFTRQQTAPQERLQMHVRYQDGTSYIGEVTPRNLSNGEVIYERNGQGLYTWGANVYYKGEFVDGKRHGYGMMRDENGMLYKGEWKNN